MVIPVQHPVTGAETLCGDNSALDALITFYRGFNGRDLAELEGNWLEGDEPSMNNPISAIRRGWPEIRSGYEKLFDGTARVTVEFYDYTHQQGADWALFVGRERGVCTGGDTRLELAIRTTRWFVLRGGRWRQMHHHGSIERSSLLAEYQRTIVGAPL
jgi:hypothetical protein